MLGPPKPRWLDRPITVSLDDLVPTDHFYRYLETTLDLSFVRDWVKDCYAIIGRPSIDPVVFFKLQLVLYLEGLRSERQLMRVAADHLSIQWYAGYNLDEPLPNHSSLTRIHQRLGLDLVRRFFEHVVELCDEAGLIWGKELLVDATKVRANASTASLVPRLTEVVDDHLVELCGEEPHPDQPEPVDHADAPALLHPERAETQSANASSERWDVLEECRLDPERPAPSDHERVSARTFSRTDRDATPIAVRYGGSALGFQNHYLIDGGKARIILHALITPGDV